MTEEPNWISTREAKTKAMACPHCGHTTSATLDSRATETYTRRRRLCGQCRCRFTTMELTQEDYDLLQAKAARLARILRLVEREMEQ